MTDQEKNTIITMIAVMAATGQISQECKNSASLALKDGESESAKSYPVKEVAKNHSLSQRTIYRYIHDGILRAIKTPAGSVRIPASEVKRVFGV